MNNNSGALSFDAVINNTDFKKQLDEMSASIRGMANTATTETAKMDAGFTKLGVAIGGALSITAAKQFISDIVTARGMFQQLDISFKTMIGNRAQADALMAQVVQTAMVTPFQLGEVASGAKQLLAYGTAANEVNDTLVRLGNIAAGLSIPLNDLIYLYGTTQVQGRLYAQDVRQFMGRGIPLVQELAKQTGKTTEQINAMVTEGKIGFPEVQKVIMGLTNQGGMFYNLMEQQSKSLTGQISNLKDNWTKMLNDIGKGNENILNSGIGAVSSLIANYEEVGKILTALIVTYGTYKAALITTNLLNGTTAISTGVYSIATKELAVSETILTTIQAGLNRVMAANPYVLIATAVVGLTSAMWAYSDSTTAAEIAQKNLSKINDDSSKAADDLKNKTQSLISTINDSNATTYQQVKAFDELRSLYPNFIGNMTLHEFQLKKTTDSQKALNAEMDKQNIAIAQQNYDAAIAKMKDYEEQINKVRSAPNLKNDALPGETNSGYIENLVKNYQAAKIEAEKLGEQVKQNTQAEWEANTSVEDKITHYKQVKSELEAQAHQLETNLLLSNGISATFGGLQNIINSINLDSLNNQISAINGNLNKLKPVQVPFTKAYFEQDKATAQGKLDELIGGKNTAAGKALEKQILADDEALKAYNVTLSKTPKEKKIDIVLPSGSLAEIDRQIKKAEDVLSKIPADQIGRIKAMQDTLASLTQQRVETEKIVEFKSWDQIIEYKKSQYTDYEKAVDNGNKRLADKQYSDLLKGGQTYIDFLKNQIAPLQAKIASDGLNTFTISGVKGPATPGLNTQETAQYISLTNELNAALGNTSSIDLFKKRIDDSKNSTQSLGEYIKILQGELESLNQDTSFNGTAKTNYLNTKIKDTLAEQKTLFEEFLVNSNANNQKVEAINAKYRSLEEEAKKQQNGKDLEDTLAVIQTKYSEELKAVSDAEIKKSDFRKRAHDEVLNYSKVELSNAISNLQKELDTEQLTFVQRQAIYEKLQIIKNQFNKVTNQQELNSLSQILNSISSFVSATSTGTDKFSKIVSDLANTVGKLGNALEQINKLNTDNSAGQKVTTGFAIADVLNSLTLTVRDAFVSAKDMQTGLEGSAEALAKVKDETSGLNDVMSYQVGLVDKLYGVDKLKGYQDMIDKLKGYQKQMLQSLSQLKISVIKGTKDVWVDPIFNQDIEKTTAHQIEAYALWALAVPEFISKTKTSLQQIDTTEFKTLDDWQNLITSIKLSGGTYGGLKINADDLTALEDYVKTLQDAKDKADQLQQTLNEAVTGTTASSIADAIVAGFQQGKRASADFANDFQSLMSKSLISLFKAKILDAGLQAFYDKFSADASSDFILTEAEIADLKASFADLINTSKDKWDQISQIIGAQNLAGLSQTDALQGAIKGVTEDTASIIAGQMNAIRINQADSLNLVRQSLLQLNTIAEYTSHLINIEKYLYSMSNIKSWRDLGFGHP